MIIVIMNAAVMPALRLRFWLLALIPSRMNRTTDNPMSNSKNDAMPIRTISLDGNERCLVLGHSMQTNERHYSFSDRRKVDDVRNKLNDLKMAQ